MTELNDTEQVVMTPKGKTANSTTIMIERRAVKNTNDKMHVAGGEHTGIVINKETVTDNNDNTPAQLSLQFRVIIVSAQTGKHTQESRTLRFWFRPPQMENGHTNHQDAEQASIAQDFFRELVSPQEFPRDYVGFIKKIMKLMQHNYYTIKKIEIELKQEGDAPAPARPLSADESTLGKPVRLSSEKVLELIESAYPNPVTTHDLAKTHNWEEEEVSNHISELQDRGLVKAMEHGAFTRQQSHDAQIIVVKQMPTIASSKQPTIAIITAQYCEKLAVDAMIENKETFVRYTTVGESNVYTLGNIGAHRIVCTKLPSVGHTREAMTAAGNTTTRLLGTFQKVDYVFLVGVGGGVPHYTDYNKHVRLGDVVVSAPVASTNVYLYCENAKKSEKGYEFEIKPYAPSNANLQKIATGLKVSADSDNGTPPWLKYLKEGLKILSSQSEQTFNPPSADTDELVMALGKEGRIVIAHPTPQDNSIKRAMERRTKCVDENENPQPEVIKQQESEENEIKSLNPGTARQEGCPRIHLSPVASGRKYIIENNELKQQFALQVGALAFDYEFDAVIESILGNCKDSFICIRGISDYANGLRKDSSSSNWQPYASLVAASVMKSIICGMDAPTNV